MTPWPESFRDTNYMYATYHAVGCDAAPSPRRKVLITRFWHISNRLSVEFDWCASCRAAGIRAWAMDHHAETINPETVSTDYASATGFIRRDQLETVLDLYEYERPDGVVVSMGGQIPNNLARA